MSSSSTSKPRNDPRFKPTPEENEETASNIGSNTLDTLRTIDDNAERYDYQELLLVMGARKSEPGMNIMERLGYEEYVKRLLVKLKILQRRLFYKKEYDKLKTIVEFIYDIGIIDTDDTIDTKTKQERLQKLTLDYMDRVNAMTGLKFVDVGASGGKRRTTRRNRKHKRSTHHKRNRNRSRK